MAKYRDSEDDVHIFVSTARKYKVYTDISLDYLCMHRPVTKLDTGEEPNFIRM